MTAFKEDHTQGERVNSALAAVEAALSKHDMRLVYLTFVDTKDARNVGVLTPIGTVPVEISIKLVGHITGAIVSQMATTPEEAAEAVMYLIAAIGNSLKNPPEVHHIDDHAKH